MLNLSRDLGLLNQEQDNLLAIITRVRDSLDIATIFQRVVTEVRNFLQADRVFLYQFFDMDELGTVVAESVGSGWRSLSGERSHDPFFQSLRRAHHQTVTIADIELANLTVTHVALLRTYQVQAAVVVPLLRYGKIWGLLVVHQCSGVRAWEDKYLTFLQQIAQQFVFALDQAEQVLRQQERVKANRDRLLVMLNRMRSSLNLPTIFGIAVEEVHDYLQADRVVLYQFDENYLGTVIAESVSPGWRPSLGELIVDTCFQTTRASQYTKDLILPTADVYNAKLTPCHLGLLEAFQVRANLVVPIFKENEIWGLLIAHQCSGPRDWEETAINFCYHVATHLTSSLLQADAIQKLQEQKIEKWAATARDQLFMMLNKLPYASSLEETLNQFVAEVRDLLQVDRAVVYRFNPDWSGSFIAESVAPGWVSLLEEQNHTPLISQNISECSVKILGSRDTHLSEYGDDVLAKTELRTVSDIYEAGFSPCYLKVLSYYQARAYIIVPIMLDDRCWGLLAVYQNDQPRKWLEAEVTMVYQVSVQLTVAIQRNQIDNATQAQITELERLARLKDDFLSTVSHELRTPLSNMSMAIAMLQRSTKPERQEYYLKSLASECKREVELINDLLDLQRLEADAQPLELEEVHVQAWLFQLIEPFKERMHSREQHLELDINPSIATIVSNGSALGRIITELLNNACKYTPSEGTISLTMQPVDDAIQFAFANNGLAIPPEALPFIFDKFYRVPSADPWKQGGTGLGLALIKRLVKQLKGTITVTSCEGETRFKVTLPLL